MGGHYATKTPRVQSLVLGAALQLLAGALGAVAAGVMVAVWPPHDAVLVKEYLQQH